MTYGYFTADISTDAAYARPTDLRKSALRAFTGENFPSAPADAFPISAPPKIRKYSTNKSTIIGEFKCTVFPIQMYKKV